MNTEHNVKASHWIICGSCTSSFYSTDANFLSIIFSKHPCFTPTLIIDKEGIRPLGSRT